MRAITQFLLPLLLNASWQILLVVMFASLCAWLLRGTAAWHRHAVWVAALGLSICLPILSSPRRPAESAPVRTEPMTVAAPSTKTPMIAATTELPESEAIEIAGPANLISPPVELAQRASIAPVRINDKLAQGLVLLYAIFVLYRCVKLFQAWRRTRAMVRTSYDVSLPEPLQTILTECQSKLEVTRFRILFSASVGVPITAGVFMPLIILPEQLLREEDGDILSSALGHELVHVARRDYILNLVYELTYLPLSFHPAAALLRRRVRQTRELCCDESVATKLVRPEVYARSLVRLIASAPLAGRLAADTTIGITDADILEVRIMSLLRRSKLSARRRALLLIAASLLLVTPCLAAASFGLTLDLNGQEPVVSAPQEAPQEATQEVSQKLQRAREELKLKAAELQERARKNPAMQGPERDELHRLERELAAAAAKMEREQAAQYSREAKDRWRQVEENLAQHRVQMQLNSERYKELVKQYPESKEYAEALEALRRAEKDFATQMQDQSKEQAEKLKLKEKELEKRIHATADKLREKELLKQRIIEERVDKNKIKNVEQEMRIRKEVAEQRRVERSRRHAELTNLASISMDRAIQVATSQFPGKVLACSLGRDAESRVFYHVVIITGDGSARYVWVSALDGQIIKSEKEDR